MAKQNSSSQLVRSDLRLLGLGLFSTALLLGVLGVLNVNLVSLSPPSDNIADQTIRVEEQPAEFSDELQNVEDSYAASKYMVEEEVTEEVMYEVIDEIQSEAPEDETMFYEE